MKAFKFTLQRMRDYKTQLLDREKNTLLALRQRRNEIQEKIENLHMFHENKTKEMQEREQQGMSAVELSAYQYFFENIRLQLKQLAIDLQKAELEVEHQLKIVVAASQEVKGLDKLEAKQRDEYNHKVAKEEENIIAEFVTQQARMDMHERR